MNKTQSLDGIRRPQFAKHMSHTAGVNSALKAEASHSVRQAYKHVIAQELNEVDPEVLDFENNHGQHGDGAELRHLVADVQKIMAANGVLSSDVQFVNHSCGSITWEEFVASISEFTYYQCTWFVEGLTNLFCVVGTNWWIGVNTFNDYEGLTFCRPPQRIPYHIIPDAECFKPAF
jgi:hypothetical protein